MAVSAEETVSTRALIEQILGKHKTLKKSQVKAVLDTLVEVSTKHLKKGAKVRITGLGTFSKSSRGARKGRNPATGEAIKIKASKSVRFKPSKTLKSAM